MSDLISRQAVLDKLNEWEWQELYLPIHFKENIIDELPSVTPTVIEDIKAEITKLQTYKLFEDTERLVALDEVLQIIDKYIEGNAR